MRDAATRLAGNRAVEPANRLEKGLAGYDRIARHAMSAEAAVAITAVASGEDDGGDGDGDEDEDSAA